MQSCPACGRRVEGEDVTVCPVCRTPLSQPSESPAASRVYWGFERRSKIEFWGIPLVHIAIGRNKQTGKLLVARGVIAIGQFAIGVFTVAQFGIGIVFGFGQFMLGTLVVAQFAGAVYFAVGQFAIGLVAIGQFAAGKYVLAQVGVGKYLLTRKVKDPEAVAFFHSLWSTIKNFLR